MGLALTAAALRAIVCESVAIVVWHLWRWTGAQDGVCLLFGGFCLKTWNRRPSSHAFKTSADARDSRLHADATKANTTRPRVAVRPRVATAFTTKSSRVGERLLKPRQLRERAHSARLWFGLS